MFCSQEQLSSQPFDQLLQDTTFGERTCAFGIDEVHLGAVAVVLSVDQDDGLEILVHYVSLHYISTL